MIAGVGHVGECRARARGTRARRGDPRASGAGRPVLGICVGMQLLFGASEEGGSGLSVLRSRAARSRPAGAPHGVERPHADRPSALLEGLDGEDVYFAHSFAVEPDDDEVIVADADHDGLVVAAVESGAVAGVQFHPERSARAGAGSSRTRWHGQEARDPLPRRCQRARGQGRQIHRAPGDGRADRACPRYSELGADELVFLDITATLEGRGPILDLIERAAAELTIPFTVGGGVTGLEDAARCSEPAPTRWR